MLDKFTSQKMYWKNPRFLSKTILSSYRFLFFGTTIALIFIYENQLAILNISKSSYYQKLENQIKREAVVIYMKKNEHLYTGIIIYEIS